MKKSFYSIIALISLIILTGCSPVSKEEHIKWSGVEKPNRINELKGKTVALVEVEDDFTHVYCSGVWLNGKILTAAHCVDDNQEITYVLYEDFVGIGMNPRVYNKGTVVKRDEEEDLALINVSGKRGNASTLGTSSIGDKVYMMGHLKGLWYTYMSGEISAKIDYLPFGMRPPQINTTFWQVNGSTGKGMSGGGLFNEAGELIGIASFIFRDNNVAFYIHDSEIKKFMEN